jgi:hypothetical protein
MLKINCIVNNLYLIFVKSARSPYWEKRFFQRY